MYFWRTHTRQEIERIEERGGKLNAFCAYIIKMPVPVPPEGKALMAYVI